MGYHRKPLYESEAAPTLGVGLSRTDSPHASLFTLRIYFRDVPPMLETLLATSSKEARQFAINRYPSAVKVQALTRKGRTPPQA